MHGLSWLILQNWTELSGTPSFWIGPSRVGADSICLCWAGGLQLGDNVKLGLWTRLGAGDYFVFGGWNKHQLRRKQHVELEDERGDQCRDHAGNVYVCVGEWFDECEPNGDDYLHVDGYECGWFDYIFADRYSNGGGQADHQLVHG